MDNSEGDAAETITMDSMTHSQGGAAEKRRRLEEREDERRKQAVKCARRIDECVTRKDYAGAAAGQSELCIVDKRRA